MRALLFLLGGVIGVFLVRGIFLDQVEIIGWELFWRGLSSGRSMNWGNIFQSATFLKCAAGFLIVGIIGFSVAKRITKKKVAKPIEEADKKDTVASENEEEQPKGGDEE